MGSARETVSLIGARNLVGDFVLDQVNKKNMPVIAYGRCQPADRASRDFITWRRLLASPDSSSRHWISLAPIWVLPDYFDWMLACGIRKIVALSSTSIDTKSGSLHAKDNDIATRLARGEQQLMAWAGQNSIDWVILRPTLIYGQGRDANVSRIARFLSRSPLFPVVGEASGLRQPIHAEDVARFVLAALLTDAGNKAVHIITGGETLSYREMVVRIGQALGRKPRFLRLPPWLFLRLTTLLHRVPLLSRLPMGMFERMNQDLAFDGNRAARLFNVSPRPFLPQYTDIIAPENTTMPGRFTVKRAFDLVLTMIGLLLLAVPLSLLGLLVRTTSQGPALYWSERVGKDNRLFRMPKFRTMRTDTPELATHLIDEPEQYVTPVGRWLRKTSLDELPQLWSVLKGDMSLVGPRPALYNQDDLIALRTAAGVDQLLPGLTGWAQVNGRDELPIPDKVRLDAEYLQHRSLWFDLKILLLTAGRVLRKQGVSH